MSSGGVASSAHDASEFLHNTGDSRWEIQDGRGLPFRFISNLAIEGFRSRFGRRVHRPRAARCVKRTNFHIVHDFVAFFVDIQTDVLMMGFHELASFGLFKLKLTNHVAPHHFGSATHDNNGGKLFAFEAKTPAAFPFTQPACLDHSTMHRRTIGRWTFGTVAPSLRRIPFENPGKLTQSI
jgi:hypothetical protein